MYICSNNNFSDLEERRKAFAELTADREKAEEEKREIEEQRRKAEEEARELQEVCRCLCFLFLYSIIAFKLLIYFYSMFLIPKVNNHYSSLW